MNISEVAAVIAAMNAVDPRVEPLVSKTDPRLAVFHKVLGKYPFTQADQAIVEYAETSHMVAMQIGNVVEGIKAIRKRNLKRIEAAQLIPPVELPDHDDGGSQYPAWMRAAQWAVADGAPDAQTAMDWADAQFGVKRRPALAAGEGVRPQLPEMSPGQARLDVVAGQVLVTEQGAGESS